MPRIVAFEVRKRPRGRVGSGTKPEYLVTAGRLQEITGVGRGPRWKAGRQPQMGENLVYHRGGFDGGEERQGPPQSY